MYVIATNWWYQWCDFVNVSVDAITKYQNQSDIRSTTPELKWIIEEEEAKELDRFKEEDLMISNISEISFSGTSELLSPNTSNPTNGWSNLKPEDGHRLSIIEEDEIYDRPQ